jgi:hypothetical protein
MTQTIDQTPPQAPPETDLVAAVQQVLQASDEPLTLSKIRSAVPARFRAVDLQKLEEILRRQVAANVLMQYPKYRSQHDRFWDRPMHVHVAHLLRSTLEEGALPWSELRRKLPAYAQAQAEAVLQEQVTQGRLYRHPRAGRGGERFGVRPADPKDYLRSELVTVFGRLAQLGFTQEQLRAGALELLHDEEWASVPAAESAPSPRRKRREARPDEEGTKAAAPQGTPPQGELSQGHESSASPVLQEDREQLLGSHQEP